MPSLHPRFARLNVVRYLDMQTRCTLVQCRTPREVRYLTSIVHVEYMDYVYGASRVLTVFILQPVRMTGTTVVLDLVR